MLTRSTRIRSTCRPNFDDMQVQTKGEFGGLGIEVTMEERLRQGRLADRRHAGRQGRPRSRRLHHPYRRRVGARPDLGEAVEQDARPGRHRHPAHHRREGGGAVRRHASPATSSRSRAVQPGRGRHRLVCASPRSTNRRSRTCEAVIAAVSRRSATDKLTGYRRRPAQQPGRPADQAVAVSDAFLEKGEIVSTRGRDPHERERFNARAATCGRQARSWC